MKSFPMPRRRPIQPGLFVVMTLVVLLGLLAASAGDSLILAQPIDPTYIPEEGNNDPGNQEPTNEPESTSPPDQVPTEFPTEQPEATMPPEQVPSEVPATEIVPTEAIVPAGGPASDTILVMVSGTCDLVIGNWPQDATSLADYQARCDEYAVDQTFTYTYRDTGVTQTQTTTGGTTSFVVDPGSFRVESVYVPGMREAIVGCESAFGSSYVRPMVRGYPPYDVGFSSHIDLGDTLTCYWYNFPSHPTILNLIKGECAVAGFDPYTASTDELARTCTQQTGDATFTYRQTATGDPASELEITQTTVGSQTSFTDVPGNFQVQEDIPAGYGDPVVSCLIERWGLNLIVPAPGGLIRGHIDGQGILTCHWYNVPLAPDGELPATGSITVVKHICGPVTGWSLLPCPILKTGQAFDLLLLTPRDWQTVDTGVTGRDGRLTWPDLVPGTYQLDELGRDWCRIESTNLEPGGKGITVNPGEDVVVHVYNCAKRTTPKPIPFPIPPPFLPGPRDW